MKRTIQHIYLIISVGFFSLTVVSAQNTVPNAGFENWTNYGNYEDPDGWGTLNQSTSLSLPPVLTVTKATGSDAHSGSYAIRLETKTVVTETVPGTAITGTYNPLTLKIDGGFGFNSMPTSLTGWYKYIPFILDAGSVEIVLTKWNPTTKIRQPVGSGIFTVINAVNTYTQFTIDVIYVSPDTPDTAIITLLSGSYTNPPGSVLYVDDMSFNYPSIGTPENKTVNGFIMYPNPASEEFFIFNSNDNTKISELTLYDYKGKKVLITKLKNNSNCVGGERSRTVGVSALSDGMYIYVIEDEGGSIVQRGKIVIWK